eukprot:Blabericola_migrator_1__2867@NODE_1820_length_3739_cov_99_008715_g185_i2_p2_GENE_NODE_1820_length_3739_cov_99_008715_g185_i2NODE_1820_length_3739_cov_99_008715_g185_i2_p2_ORF_typecomplete_len494_score45_80Hexokinase_1/PF00349_21/4e31Hexokinase_2/PF03727_16/8_1e30KRTAP7/PF15034_6/0_16_NODE_1820_length_3739_cov_99_008715_g185_i2621543
MGLRLLHSSNGEEGEKLPLCRPPGKETFKDRVKRYVSLFTLSSTQLLSTHREIVKDMDFGCKSHFPGYPLSAEARHATGCWMLDTFISVLPTGNEIGHTYGVGFASTQLTAIKAHLDGNGSMQYATSSVNLLNATQRYPLGLLDMHCTASELFDCVAACLGSTIDIGGNEKEAYPLPIGFVMGFPCHSDGIRSARLTKWVKGFETGRATDDKVEGFDVVCLLERSMHRLNVPGSIAGLANDTPALLLAGAYECRLSKKPSCLVSCIMGVGFNVAYVDPCAEAYGYRGVVINTEISRYHRINVSTDIDREVDFNDESAAGDSVFEKLVGGGYLGEICRRLLLRIWQAAAPRAAWMCQALPTAAATLCVADSSENLAMIDRIMGTMWEWQTDYPTRVVIKGLFGLVFERSAALAATAVAASLKRTGLLFPGSEGVTVALDDGFHVQQAWFQAQITKYLSLLLGPEMAGLVSLYVVSDGLKKGAAILGHMAQAKPT